MKSPSQSLTLIALLAGALALPACSDQKSQQTAGQKLDAAVADAKVQANEAKQSIEDATADARDAVHDAANSAETKAKETGVVAERKLEGAGQAVDDSAITAGVKAKLVAADELKAMDIKVTTEAGHVTLEGKAPSTQAREHATQLAFAVDGVRVVNNKLQVGS